MTCPRRQFHDNLIKLLTSWREAGNQIIVCLDTNQNIYANETGRSLTDKDGLDMVEVGDYRMGFPLGETFFRGTEQIDRVWATRDVQVANACVMPVGFGVGDPQLFVVDSWSCHLWVPIHQK